MLPIAECFVSPQGEGLHAGKLMVFLRLAGCTVGTRYPKERYQGTPLVFNPEHENLFPIYTNECHIYDGRTMACDTDYRKQMSCTYEEILQLLQNTHATCKTVCLTGGEPLMHEVGALRGLCFLLRSEGYAIHLETSGTIPVTKEVYLLLIDDFDYIAVSPKLGYIPEYTNYADEFKILVDENFDRNKIPPIIPHDKIWWQPVNGEHTVNEENMKRCLALQLLYPETRISSQAHKLWGTR